MSPETLSPPVLISTTDERLAKAVYRKFGTFTSPTKGSWTTNPKRIFSLSDPGDIFRNYKELKDERHTDEWHMIATGRSFHIFDHRFSSFKESGWEYCSAQDKTDPDFRVHSKNYVHAEAFKKKFPGRIKPWHILTRDTARATDERTVISSILPLVACDTTCWSFDTDALDTTEATTLAASLSSFVFDYFARQKVIGTHLSAGIFKQLPLAHPLTLREASLLLNIGSFILDAVLELSYTAWELQHFAQDCGYDGPPFRWDAARRFLLRCELDAAFFHLYGIERDDVDYIMETFPIVKRKDVKEHGDYRTKLQILQIYDAMQRAMSTGEPYQTLLDPPPADPRVAHPPREEE